MKDTTRTGDTGQNFHEVSEGDAPSSAEITINAKGIAQVTFKLYYGDPGLLQDAIALDIEETLREIKAGLARLGIPLAGSEKEQA